MTTVIDVDAIERDSIRASIPELVEYLQGELGPQLAAYVTGLENPTLLARWQSGTEPRKAAQLRLRYAYRAARMIIEAFDVKIAEAWFFGANGKLDDNAPAWVLRTARTVEDLRFLIPAAKAFAKPPE